MRKLNEISLSPKIILIFFSNCIDKFYGLQITSMPGLLYWQSAKKLSDYLIFPCIQLSHHDALLLSFILLRIFQGVLYLGLFGFIVLLSFNRQLFFPGKKNHPSFVTAANAFPNTRLINPMLQNAKLIPFSCTPRWNYFIKLYKANQKAIDFKII